MNTDQLRDDRDAEMTRRLSLIRDLCDAPEASGLPRGVALREIEEIASGEAGWILPTDLQT